MGGRRTLGLRIPVVLRVHIRTVSSVGCCGYGAGASRHRAEHGRRLSLLHVTIRGAVVAGVACDALGASVEAADALLLERQRSGITLASG